MGTGLVIGLIGTTQQQAGSISKPTTIQTREIFIAPDRSNQTNYVLFGPNQQRIGRKTPG